MQTCPTCGHQQEGKNFCGQCGTSLKEVNTNANSETVAPETTSHTEATAQPHPQVEKLTNYWNYFVSKLKQPSKDITESEFLFALITTVIALLLWVLVPFTIMSKSISSLGRFSISSSLGFGDFINMLFYMGIFYVLTVIVSLFLAQKLGSLPSWKYGIAKIGAFNTWMVFGFVILLVLVLFGTLIFATSLYTLLTFIFIFLVPLYTVSTSFKKQSSLDPYILFLISIVILLTTYAIMYAIFFEKLASELGGFYNYF